MFAYTPRHMPSESKWFSSLTHAEHYQGIQLEFVKEEISSFFQQTFELLLFILHLFLKSLAANKTIKDPGPQGDYVGKRSASDRQHTRFKSTSNFQRIFFAQCRDSLMLKNNKTYFLQNQIIALKNKTNQMTHGPCKYLHSFIPMSSYRRRRRMSTRGRNRRRTPTGSKRHSQSPGSSGIGTPGNL